MQLINVPPKPFSLLVSMKLTKSLETYTFVFVVKITQTRFIHLYPKLSSALRIPENLDVKIKCEYQKTNQSHSEL